MNINGVDFDTYFNNYPDKNGFFGKYGGQYVPEVLIPALDELERTFIECKDDPTFKKELSDLLNKYAGRPTPLTLCKNLTKGTTTMIEPLPDVMIRLLNDGGLIEHIKKNGDLVLEN